MINKKISHNPITNSLSSIFSTFRNILLGYQNNHLTPPSNMLEIFQ